MQENPIVCERFPAVRTSLRIAVVTETFPPEVNGVALSIARFVDGLRRLNHEIQLIRPRQSASDVAGDRQRYEEVLMRGMQIPRYPGLRMGLPARRLLLRMWSRQRPDLVHIVTEGPLGWSALEAALRLGLPVTSDFRTNFHAYSRHYGVGWLHKPIAAYLRKFHNRTNLTMVPTERMRNELTVLGFRNLAVVARGVDTALFNPARRSEALRNAWGAGPDDPVALSVGRLAPEKNLEVVFAAFEKMRSRKPCSKLVLVGDGPARASLQARYPRAIYAGTRRGEELAACYASSDIFLFPSLTETFGNVTLEAMSSGLAVVAYDYAAASEHIMHGGSGYLAAFDDTPHFASLAADLVEYPDRIRAFGARARAVAETLEWNRVVERMESMLLSLVQRPVDPPLVNSMSIVSTLGSPSS